MRAGIEKVPNISLFWDSSGRSLFSPLSSKPLFPLSSFYCKCAYRKLFASFADFLSFCTFAFLNFSPHIYVIHSHLSLVFQCSFPFLYILFSSRSLKNSWFSQIVFWLHFLSFLHVGMASDCALTVISLKNCQLFWTLLSLQLVSEEISPTNLQCLLKSALLKYIAFSFFFSLLPLLKLVN